MTYSALHTTRWGVIRRTLGRGLIDAELVEVGEWQSQDVRDKPEMATRELMNVSFQLLVPNYEEDWQEMIGPNMPWAEDHFLERISGIPHNPPPSEQWWPFAQEGNSGHKMGQLFSHTYPERMWPKRAGHLGQRLDYERMGIRFAYGDLGDVVQLLRRSPLTRQAFLPIWFPEDTGNTMRERVPCTLGYHFMIRSGRLHCVYYMRSCDFLRHMPDDIYMAGRLLQWVVDQLCTDIGDAADKCPSVGVGTLTTHITSLHIFEGDMPMMEMNYAPKP